MTVPCNFSQPNRAATSFAAEPSPGNGCCLAHLPFKPKRFLQKQVFKANYPSSKASKLDRSILDKVRSKAADSLILQGCPVRRLCLEKDGREFDALTSGANDPKGDWCLFVPNHGQPMEYHFEDMTLRCQALGLNLLMVNGPGIGRSEGSLHEKSLGRAEEAALQYLEDEAKARRVLIVGDGMGALALNQAFMTHRFHREQGPIYVAGRVNAPAKLSTAFSGWRRRAIKHLAHDVRARRLSQKCDVLKFHEVIGEPCAYATPNGFMEAPTVKDLERAQRGARDRLAAELLDEPELPRFFMGSPLMTSHWAEGPHYHKSKAFDLLLKDYHRRCLFPAKNSLSVPHSARQELGVWLDTLQLSDLDGKLSLWEGLANTIIKVFTAARPLTLPDKKSCPQLVPLLRKYLVGKRLAELWTPNCDALNLAAKVRDECREHWRDFDDDQFAEIRDLAWNMEFRERFFGVVGGILLTEPRS